MCDRHDEAALGAASKVQAVPAGQDARLATIAVQVCRLLPGALPLWRVLDQL